MSFEIVGDRPWFVAKLKKFFSGASLVEAGEDGLDAGTVQEALQSLASRVQGLEDAAGG